LPVFSAAPASRVDPGGLAIHPARAVTQSAPSRLDPAADVPASDAQRVQLTTLLVKERIGRWPNPGAGWVELNQRSRNGLGPITSWGPVVPGSPLPAAGWIGIGDQHVCLQHRLGALTLSRQRMAVGRHLWCLGWWFCSTGPITPTPTGTGPGDSLDPPPFGTCFEAGNPTRSPLMAGMDANVLPIYHCWAVCASKPERHRHPPQPTAHRVSWPFISGRRITSRLWGCR